MAIENPELAVQIMYPEYGDTRALDELRGREYSRLDRLGQVYLDYTGGGLYAESQVRRHAELLAENVFGNPHSSNPTSAAMTDLVEQTRAAILSYFRAAAEEYEVVFTLNASGALKLVGEAFPFRRGSQYLLTFDNHNSVNGIREFARARGATVQYAPITDPSLAIDDEALTSLLDRAQPDRPNLFAYPAQSNFSGVQHSLEWISRAQERGWTVLLDSAAFVPTNRLDLSRWHPDFVALSFYKVFGYPTGIGCLLGRREAMGKLHRPWFAGGTIALASVPAGTSRSRGFRLLQGEAAFEDGTINYLGVPAIDIGLRHIESVGIDVIHERVRCLTGFFLEQLQDLRHGNGTELVHIYGPANLDGRGGTVTFNLFDAEGRLIHPQLVERAANARSISVRTGCHCNPGAGETALSITPERMESYFVSGSRMSTERFLHVADDLKAGAVRVSFGIVSNVSDVVAFMELARGLVDQRGGTPEAMQERLGGHWLYQVKTSDF
jgi:selenocysteine lyase/cysteine desulfurase